MLGNKVSPASLLGSEPSVMTENTSGTDDSQSQRCNSQVSLFGCGSDPPSSMELFPDTHSQPQSQAVDKFLQRSTTQPRSKVIASKIDSGHLPESQAVDKFLQRSTTQPRSKVIASKIDSGHLPEIPLNRMFFAKYLKSSRSEQQNMRKSEDSQTSRSNQTYEVWKTKQADKFESQHFMAEIQKAVKEGMNEVKGELKSDIEELRTAVAEQQSGITRNQLFSSQIIASIADLKQCVEQCYQERVNSHAMPTWQQSQNAMLSLKLDGLFEDLHKRVQSLETLIESSLTRNTVPTSSTTSLQKSVYTQPEPEKGEPSAARCINGNDQAVPLRKDLLRNDTFTEPELHTQQANAKDCLARKVSQTGTDQSVISTVCDTNLTKQSLSACSQMVPNVLKLEENDAHSEKIKGLNRRKIQKSEKANTRRSQRLKRTSPKYYEIESSDAEYSFQPKRRKASQAKQRQQKSRTQLAKTPRGELDNYIFSQTPVVSPNFTATIEQPKTGKLDSTTKESLEKVHRSMEAARQMFEGLSSPNSALLKFSSAIIKQQQEGYFSD